MKIKPLPSLEYLNECFTLDETCPSGLRWKVRPQYHFPTARGCATFNSQRANNPAGCLIDLGTNLLYYTCGISGRVYMAHRIVYSMHHKVELSIDLQIDHRDNNTQNNVPSNLRPATKGLNSCNASKRKDNSSGHKGVFYRKDTGNWRGIVVYEGKTYEAGTSPSKEVVVKLVRELREKLHKDFCHHGE